MRSLIRITGPRRKSGRPRPRKPVAIAPPPRLSVESLKSFSLKPDNGLQTSDSRLQTVVVERARLNQTRRRLFEFLQRHRADIALGPLAHGHLSFFHLAVAEHQHEWDLL